MSYVILETTTNGQWESQTVLRREDGLFYIEEREREYPDGRWRWREEGGIQLTADGMATLVREVTNTKTVSAAATPEPTP